jgi:hypothetical protein
VAVPFAHLHLKVLRRPVEFALDPFAQQSGEGSRILKRRQVPGVWPVDAPGTGDPGDHTPGGVVHCVQVEPAYQDEHGNLDLAQPDQGRRVQLLLLDVVPVSGHLERPPLHASHVFTD